MINFLAPPESPEKETTARTQIFYRVVIGSAIIVTFTSLFEMAVMPQNNQRWIFIALIFDFVSVGLLFLNSRRRTALASYLFANLLLVLIFGLAWTGGGIKAPAMQESPIVVLAVGLILGWKNSVLYAAVSVAASAGLVGIEYLGLLPASAVVPTSLSMLANLTMQIGLLVLLQYLIVGRLDKALRASKEEVVRRTKVDEALRSSEERMRAIVEGTPHLFFFTQDVDANTTYVSPTVEQITGYTVDTWLKRKDWFVTEAESNQLAKEKTRAHLRGEVTNEPTFVEIRHAKGDTILLEAYEYPIIQNGKITGLQGVAHDITERKRAEKALRDNEERYRELITFSPDALYVHVDGRVVLVNPAICQLLGADNPSQLIGKSVFDIVHPDYHEGVRERWKLIDTDQSVPLVEEKFVRVDGSSVAVEVTAVAIDWKGATGVQVIARDITERKRAEEALRFERLLLRTLIDNIPDSIYSKDMSCRKTLANTAEVRNLRLNSEADVIGKNDFDLYPKELAEGFFADDQFVLKSGKPLLEREEYVFDEKGQKRWLLTSKLPLRDKEGRTVGLVGIGRDITERKLAIEELRKLSLAIEQNPTTIVITDIYGKIEYVNPKFTQVTGYTLEEVRGKNPSILKSGETSADEYRKMWETITAGKAWRGEFRNKKKNGEFFWELASISPVKNQENVIVNFVAVKEDITERKEVEEALRQSQKLESIGTLAGGIAHDFNNLINAILGQSTLAMNKLSNENPAKDHIEKSIKAAERAADLTRHLLAYSGKGKFITEEIDLNRLVKENIQILEVSVPKTAQLLFELGTPSPHIQGDVGQIQQVIMNLIINAGEAIAANPGYITVQSAQVELTENDSEYWKYTNAPLQRGRYALLRVSDTGHGIKPEVLARIFDPFFTTKFTGRGLGLAAVLGIVRGHHGGLRIESSEGRGTTFEVAFPLMDAPTTGADAEQKAIAVIDGKGRTVLAIDDEPSILELLKDIFADANFKTIQASNPMHGIDLYRQHRDVIAMVVLDYSMPGMDGKAAFEELVKIDSSVKVLLCSGYSEEEMKAAFSDIQPSGFIKKPYKPSEFLESVSNVLSEGTSGA